MSSFLFVWFVSRCAAEQNEPRVGAREGRGAHSWGVTGISTAPGASVLCSAGDAVFVMAPSAAGAGFH